MSLINTIRERLQAFPGQLLSAIASDRDGSALPEVLQAWATLTTDIDNADRLQLIDEDTADLIGSVAALASELSGSYRDLETELSEARASFQQDLAEIIPEPPAAHKSTNRTPHNLWQMSPSQASAALTQENSLEQPFKWLINHIHNPYPTKAELNRLAHDSLISVTNLLSFFRRMRERSGWNRIKRLRFFGSRSGIVSAATQLFSSQDLANLSVPNEYSQMTQNISSGSTSALWHRESMIYRETVLSCYRKECQSPQTEKTRHTTILSPISNETTDSSVDSELLTSISDNESRLNGTSIAQGLNYKNNSSFVSVSERKTSSCLPMLLKNSPVSQCNRKRTRSSSRESSPTSTDITSASDTDGASDQLITACSRPTKRSRPTLEGYDRPLRGLTSLSRLESRSMTDLHTPPAVPHSRVRRNSETAATAPWPLPSYADSSSPTSTQMSSDPLLHSTGTAMISCTQTEGSSSLLDYTDTAFQLFDFNLPSSEEASASLYQQLDTAIDASLCLPNEFDVASMNPDSWSFGPLSMSKAQGSWASIEESLLLQNSHRLEKYTSFFWHDSGSATINSPLSIQNPFDSSFSQWNTSFTSCTPCSRQPNIASRPAVFGTNPSLPTLEQSVPFSLETFDINYLFDLPDLIL